MKNIALLGAAHIHTPNFVRILKQRQDCQVAWVWDHDPQRAAKNAASLDCQSSSRLEEVLQDPKIEAVIICSETNRHAELINCSVQAGKHLFVEKPLAMNGIEAEALAGQISKSGLIFQTGYFMRGNPIYRFLKQHIAKGSFGKITRIRLSNCHSGLFRGYFEDEWSWMAKPKQAGCGAFGDLGTHALDLLLWLYGLPDSVTAQLARPMARYPGCDELGEAMLCYADGCLASIAASWVDLANPMPFMLSATEGHAFVLDNQLYLKCENLPGAEGNEPWLQLPEALPHALELFLDAINGKEADLVSAKEAALRNKVMDAIYSAAAKQCWEKID